MPKTCKPHMLSDYPLGYSKYSYETLDPFEEVMAPGYFGPAAHLLRQRDIIEVWANVVCDPVFVILAVTHVDAEQPHVETRLLSEVIPLRDGPKSAPAKPRRKG